MECWLVNHNLNALGFEALHDSLDGTLTEIIAPLLHGETIDSYLARIFGKNNFCNMVFPCSVRCNNS